MRRKSLSLFVALVCGLGLAERQGQAFQIEAGPRQDGSLTVPGADSAQQSAPPESTRRFQEKQKRGEEFVFAFLLLSPKKRIARWQTFAHQGVRQSLDDALIVFGVDTVPSLARLVREGWKPDWTERSTEAVRILCDMDRFVPSDKFPLANVRTTVHVPSRNVHGLINPYIPVDGHRIGKEGYEAVKWASEQWDNRKLRFFTRYYSGLLEKDLSQMPVEDQVHRWRDDAACHEFGPCMDGEKIMRGELLAETLADEAPGSIPPLLDLLSTDSSGFARLGVVELLEEVDAIRMRLDATEVGRRALTVSLDTLDPKNVKRMFPMAWIQGGPKVQKEMETRNELWKRVAELQPDDHLNNAVLADLTLFFHAFAQFYGEKPNVPYDSRTGEVLPTPEIRKFVAFLTKTDPYFPSWEYPSSDKLKSATQVLQPRFQAKVARYHEQWQRFQQSGVQASGGSQ